jgi:hypothetical protein
MNKKITLITILFLVLSVVLFSAKKEQQELYLKAVAEKDLATKMELLKEYEAKYGQKKDKFLRFIYLNLADTAHKLKKYDEAIQYGETALQAEDIDPTNKLNVLFALANSYYTTKKDFDKALEHAKALVEFCGTLIEKVNASGQDQEKKEEFIDNYRKFFIAPAHRLQSLVYYAKGKDEPENIKMAAENALKAYEFDPSENSVRLAFSIAGNLYKKNLYTEAIAVAEKIIDKENPSYNHANFLATLYYKKKNKTKAIYYYELAYKIKRQKGLAMKIASMVHKTDITKGIRYFADAFVLSELNKESDAYKYLEHLYFNKFAKDKSVEEKEEGFKQIISAAKQRCGVN